MEARSSITIQGTPDDLQARWRELQDRPGFEGLRSAIQAGEMRCAPAPGGRGTEITVVTPYRSLGGPIGAAVAKLTHADPTHEVRDGLRRFKQLVETGEVARSDGNPLGSTKGLAHQQHAQPLPADEVGEVRERARQEVLA